MDEFFVFFFFSSFIRSFVHFVRFYLFVYLFVYLFLKLHKKLFVFSTHIICEKKFAMRARSNRKQNGMKRISYIYHFGVVFFHLVQLTKIYHCFLDLKLKLKLKLASAPFCCLFVMASV